MTREPSPPDAGPAPGPAWRAWGASRAISRRSRLRRSGGNSNSVPSASVKKPGVSSSTAASASAAPSAISATGSRFAASCRRARASVCRPCQRRITPPITAVPTISPIVGHVPMTPPTSRKMKTSPTGTANRSRIKGIEEMCSVLALARRSTYVEPCRLPAPGFGGTGACAGVAGKRRRRKRRRRRAWDSVAVFGGHCATERRLPTRFGTCPTDFNSTTSFSSR